MNPGFQIHETKLITQNRTSTSSISTEHAARFLNSALVVFSVADDGRLAPFILAAFKVAAGVGGRVGAVVRGVDTPGCVIGIALCRVAVG